MLVHHRVTPSINSLVPLMHPRENRCVKVEWTFRLFTILLGKNGWSTVIVNEMRQIPNGNFHWDVLVPFPRVFSE